MRNRGSPSGPVVILGSADSVFTPALARLFLDRGREVRVVSMQSPHPDMPTDVEVIDARPRSLAARAGFRLVRPLAHFIQRTWMERSLSRFQEATGKERPDEWEWAVWDQLEHAWRLSRLALAQRPRCVIGQELAGYGVPAAFCRGVPRILQPWGSDIFITPESWPGAGALIRFAVRRAELLIPSSATAAAHLERRFGVPAERVFGVCYGIDPALVVTTATEERARICSQWGIDPSAVIVQNVRRFRRPWGSEAALQAFLALGRSQPNLHFVLVGGTAGVPEIAEALRAVESAKLQRRFTVIDRQVTPREYHDLARVTDVAVSLMVRGDMRSASVLTQAATGAALVLAEHPEYRLMEPEGFRATFVDPGDSAAVIAAIAACAASPDWRREQAAANREYILRCENQTLQADRIAARVEAVCDAFYAQRR